MPSIVEDYIVISLFYRPIQIRFSLPASCSVHESICSVIIELSRDATFSFRCKGERGLFSVPWHLLLFSIPPRLYLKNNLHASIDDLFSIVPSLLKRLNRVGLIVAL